MKHLFLSVLVFLSFFNAQENPKEINIKRISKTPVIDGTLSSGEWDNLPLLSEFIQFAPYNGQPSKEKSEARVGYDNNALYISAFFFDSQSDKITRYLSERDAINPEITDVISLIISPYDDKNSGQGFMVSSTNIQLDRKFLPDRSIDITWNSVWESATSINDKGWSVEIRIPFSALRFSSKDIQDWGFNIWRKSARNAEWSTWSYADNSYGNFFSYYGKLKGFENITPPLRLSFTPYISGYFEKNALNKWGRSYNLGMDIKYGINESFTLDMILVPDFSQIQTDDQELNLTPYEIQYNEKRQFFTEGTELFSKGNIFYSRRIGSRPVDYNKIYDSIGEEDSVKENPIETKLINAFKLSGRTQGGLGIGVFNAMTSKAEAEIINKNTGKSREIETQPFTNYNMLVFDYKLSETSYISFINTNVSRNKFVANVTGLDFRFATESNSYSINGITTFSYRNMNIKTENGYSVELTAGKNTDNFQYNYSFSLYSDKYNCNDMGYLQKNNIVKHLFEFNYNIYEPSGIFNDLYNSLRIKYIRLFNPDKYLDFNLIYEICSTLKNQWYLSFLMKWIPLATEDYYEPRTYGRKVNLYKKLHSSLYFETDSREMFSFNSDIFYEYSYDFITDYSCYSINMGSKFQINNQLNLSYYLEYENKYNDVGYVENKGNNIYFGERDVKTISNTLAFNYNPDKELNLSVRARHYWSEARYIRFFDLKENGNLAPSGYKGNHDENYNAFNIDATLKWLFLPGSELSLMWKNAIYTSNSKINESYFKNLSEVLDNPQSNSFSMKILYYLDYNLIF